MTYISLSSDFLKFFHLGQFLSNYWSYRVILVLVKCMCLGQFLSNYCSYSQWYLVHAYILAWPLECSHPYLTLTSISQSIRHATLSYLLISSFWILMRMFALISSRSGSQSAMILRWALQGHHGSFFFFFFISESVLFVLLNKLSVRFHTHLRLSANQITWSRLLI